MCGERGCAWQKGGMRGEGGHAWQRGPCMAKGACMVGAVHGKGVCVQERRPLNTAVCILLECSLVVFINIDDGNFSVQ